MFLLCFNLKKIKRFSVFKIYSCSNQKNVVEKAVTINLAKSSKIPLERPRTYRISLKERVRCVITFDQKFILHIWKFASLM